MSGWHYYLVIFFFCCIVYVYEVTFLVLNKEIVTPLRLLFGSILRRDMESDEEVFKKATRTFHGDIKGLDEPLA